MKIPTLLTPSKTLLLLAVVAVGAAVSSCAPLPRAASFTATARSIIGIIAIMKTMATTPAGPQCMMMGIMVQDTAAPQWW